MAASWAHPGPTEWLVTGLSATDSAPSSPDDGMDVRGLKSFALTLECDAGQSFATSAGQLDLWWFDPFVGAWSYVAETQRQIPPESVGKRRITFVFDVLNRRGKLAYVPNGLSLSAGGITAFYAPVNQ
jgi:hypothetical protein